MNLKKGMNEMMNNMKNDTYIRNGKSYDFSFKTVLSAYDKLTFVKTVVDTLIDESGYDVIVKDLIFDFAIVKVFSDIDTSFINVRDDDGNDINPIIPIEQFLEETDVVDIIKENIDVGLLGELNKAVDLNVQYLTGIHQNPLNEALASLLSTLEKKINEVDLNSMMGMAQKFAGMTGELTPESIINAYINSDIHKSNLVEIEEAKKQKAKKKK